MTKKRLLARIDAFLKERKKSDGGYAPVTDDEMGQLRTIIDGLIALKYEEDPDGDHPVDVILTDRTRFERPMHLPVRYAHKPVDGYSELELHLRAVSTFNSLAESAQHSASMHMRSVDVLMSDHRNKHKALVLGDTRFVAKPPKGLTLDEVRTTLLTMVKAAYRRNPCPVDFQQRNKWADDLMDKASKKLGIKFGNTTCMHTTGGVRMFIEVPAFDVTLRVVTDADGGAKAAD